ncbi:hypothetical protein BGZ82_000719, partial [Podila clonocystis]
NRQNQPTESPWLLSGKSHLDELGDSDNTAKNKLVDPRRRSASLRLMESTAENVLLESFLSCVLKVHKLVHLLPTVVFREFRFPTHPSAKHAIAENTT